MQSTITCHPKPAVRQQDTSSKCPGQAHGWERLPQVLLGVQVEAAVEWLLGVGVPPAANHDAVLYDLTNRALGGAQCRDLSFRQYRNCLLHHLIFMT